ncbi:hypothetical protein BM523_17665 [Alteromonas mediterranea]|nr:hypothetical protein BM523_17665 [Alteromonas mediterranea]APD99309.1 hypothetical protein BM525_17685 [Alteromonas mediterranea]
MVLKSRYALNQSPLFKLHSKKKLASLLRLDSKELLALAANPNNFHKFNVEKNGKLRSVQVPKKDLEAVHLRLFNLLRRLETPPYLHSGIKGCSHVTNALAHDGAVSTAKLDIKKYYPSTGREYVYNFFKISLCCSADVAKVLSDLSCVDGHIPTGSALSQLLAFFATQQMFDEIAVLASDSDICFTLYVDDLTFSGTRVNPNFIWQVKQIISKYGYTYHKVESAPPNKTKIVTGLALTANGAKVRNSHHEKIHELYVQYLDDTIATKDLARLIGMLSSASQVNQRMANKLRNLLESRASK